MSDFLIIRNRCDTATEYTNWIGEGLKQYLEGEGYSVTDLSDVDASPEKVEEWLKYDNMKTIKAVIGLDHGSPDVFWGEKNNALEKVIKLSNAKELTKKLHVYTLACSTNADSGLGQKAVEKGCFSWFGYKEPVYAAKSQSFKDCIWSYVKAMAEKKTMEECEAALKQAYQDRIGESFIYQYNLDRMLLRKNHDDMTIDSHNRNLPDNNHDNNCFFALAALGNSFAPNVQFLRQVRDQKLRRTRVGNAFVDAYECIYYSFSPSVVKTMHLNPKFKRMIRKLVVAPVVKTLTGMFRPLRGKFGIPTAE